MDKDRKDIVNTDHNEKGTFASQEASRSQLNNHVAMIIALLVTFMGSCKIKDDNIVQEMQQAQADKVDHWYWYQTLSLREEVANANIVQLQLQAISQPLTSRPFYEKQIAVYQQLAQEQNKKKEELRVAAENDQKKYDKLNIHDDQFDLSEALLSMAIALFAITSLLQKRWLFGLAMLPTAFGLVMGLAGLFNWNIHPNALTKLLSAHPLKHSVVRKITTR